ncbi:hypothetical protein BD414DRAFT_487751 [Trametes punicea]|nr:hypothetical protein BD414DRAFT_487751 [Trametes punicea]
MLLMTAMLSSECISRGCSSVRPVQDELGRLSALMPLYSIHAVGRMGRWFSTHLALPVSPVENFPTFTDNISILPSMFFGPHQEQILILGRRSQLHILRVAGQQFPPGSIGSRAFLDADLTRLSVQLRPRLQRSAMVMLTICLYSMISARRWYPINRCGAQAAVLRSERCTFLELTLFKRGRSSWHGSRLMQGIPGMLGLFSIAVSCEVNHQVDLNLVLLQDYTSHALLCWLEELASIRTYTDVTSMRRNGSQLL